MEQATASVFSEIDSLVEIQMRSSVGDISLPATVVEKLELSGVQSSELRKIVGPADEILRLVESKKDLTPELAERVSRLAHVLRVAEAVFGRREKSFLWLRARNAELGDKTPIDLLETESGARIVEEALMRIEYGVFS